MLPYQEQPSADRRAWRWQTIVKGLAQRIADGEVPSFASDKQILALDLSRIAAGTKDRGQFEERLKAIVKEVMKSQNAILFIDDLHTLVDAGSPPGSVDASNVLEPALSRGEIQCIGALYWHAFPVPGTVDALSASLTKPMMSSPV